MPHAEICICLVYREKIWNNCQYILHVATMPPKDSLPTEEAEDEEEHEEDHYVTFEELKTLLQQKEMVDASQSKTQLQKLQDDLEAKRIEIVKLKTKADLTDELQKKLDDVKTRAPPAAPASLIPAPTPTPA